MSSHKNKEAARDDTEDRRKFKADAKLKYNKQVYSMHIDDLTNVRPYLHVGLIRHYHLLVGHVL